MFYYRLKYPDGTYVPKTINLTKDYNLINYKGVNDIKDSVVRENYKLAERPSMTIENTIGIVVEIENFEIK